MSRTVFSLLICSLWVGCKYNQFTDFEPITTPLVVTCALADLPINAPIEWDAIAQGVVVSSDSTGNFYREVVIQQQGTDFNVALQVNAYDIFAVWRMGMVVGIKFRGLGLSIIDGRTVAGIWGADGNIAPIPSLGAGVERVHFQGFYAAPTILKRSIADIDEKDAGKLVELLDVYFVNQGTTFGGSQRLEQVGINATISLYTSPYASFATDIVPIGTVDMVAFVTLNPSGHPQLKCSYAPTTKPHRRL